MKLHLLDLGRLDYDEGFPLVAGAVSRNELWPPD